ncbi:MT-A70 family methyltransferase [Alienimonas sp. DA493]|uniref:MT-A70 family methyltransferase n=1 Tax=Alienimonas sp. DA493 TaxID=3373605 RepID=UPI0037546842
MSAHPALIRYDEACAAIARAESVGEVKEMRDQAEAMRVYAKQASLSLDMQNKAAELKLRAERKAGELIAASDIGKGVKCNTLSHFGIGRHQSSRWQSIARVPADAFEEYVSGTIEAGKELTTAGALKLAKKLARPDATPPPEPDGGGCTVGDLHALAATGEKFGTVYADPAWSYGNQGTRAATGNHYVTMTVEDIAALPVADLAADKAHLHLWTTNAFLRDAFDIIEAWGFEYRSILIWHKPQVGIGNYWRINHEFLLLGIRGGLQFPPTDDAMTAKKWSVVEHDRIGHSRKPPLFRRLIETVSPGPRLELFGREQVPGWSVWGNEVARSLFVPPTPEASK